MNAADCLTESRNCFVLARIAKSEPERLALLAEGRRFAALGTPAPSLPVAAMAASMASVEASL